MFTLLLVAVVLLICWLLYAGFLWFGARLVAGPKYSYGWAVVVAVLLHVIGGFLAVGEYCAANSLSNPTFPVLILLLVATFLVTLLLNGWVIAGMFSLTFPRAVLVWLFGLLSLPLSVAFLYFVVFGQILVLYVVPVNPMSPTVIGWHNTGVCPHCQGLLLLSAEPPEMKDLRFRPQEQHGVCAACRKSSDVAASDAPPEGPDHIVVNKLLRVQRRDIVAYQLPERATRGFAQSKIPVKTVSRVVGLPGETVYIEDDALWVNGTRLEFPPEMAGQVYRKHPFDMGTQEQPWHPGAGEYVLLGDNTEASNDSRIWGPLAGSEIEGVVTITYWPPSRWKVFR